MKFNSKVVTTSSTPNRVFSSAGPSSSKAPASIAAAMISGISSRGGSGSRPVPNTTVTTPPI